MHGVMQEVTIGDALGAVGLAGAVGLVWGLVSAVTAVCRRRRERVGTGPTS